MEGSDSLLLRVEVAALPVLALVNATVLVTLGPAYWHLRHRSAIRTRNPRWTLLNMALLVLMLLNYAYDGWRRYPSCPKILFTNVVLAPIVVDVYVIRCWMLLFHWHVSRALCVLESDAVLTPDGRGFHGKFGVSDSLCFDAPNCALAPNNAPAVRPPRAGSRAGPPVPTLPPSSVSNSS